MVKVFCDRCCGMIDRSGWIGHISWTVNDGGLDGMPGPDAFKGHHFCMECMAAILEAVQGGGAPKESRGEEASRKSEGDVSWKPGRSGEEGAPRKSEGEDVSGKPGGGTDAGGQEAGKGRRRIDIGKVTALRNAGWSVAKIADEMGMHPQSIVNAIHRHSGKKGAGGE